MKSNPSLLVLPAALVASLLATAGPVSADGNDETNPPAYIPVGYACPDFNVGYTWTGAERVHHRTILDKDGNVVGSVGHTSSSVVTFINYGTDPWNPVAGKTYTARVAGSTYRADYGSGTETITMTGQNNWLTLRGPEVPEGVSTTLHTGKVVFTVDYTTGVTVESAPGPKVDLCAELR